MFLLLIFLSLILNPISSQCDIFLADACCPAESPLLLLCGDGICESEQGENAQICPLDCQNPSTKPISWNPITRYCSDSLVYYPKTLSEIKLDLKETILLNEELKIWGAGHSNNFELCSNGRYMVLGGGFNTIHGIEDFNGEEVVKVDGGVTFSELNRYLMNIGKSIGYIMTQFGDITVAGCVANDGHGSNAGEEGSDCPKLIRSIDKMNQRGIITSYSKKCTKHSLWKALMSDQGMMGITVRIRIKVRELFNVEIRIFSLPDNDVFKPDGMKNIADNCQNFMIFTWFRSVGQSFVTCGTETTQPVTAPDAINRLLIPDLEPSQLAEFLLAFQEAACNNSLNNFLEVQSAAQFELMNWVQYTINGTIFHSNTGIGYSNRMLEVSEAESIANGFPYVIATRDFEISIPETVVDEAMGYIKAYLTENEIFFPLLGVLIRVGRYNNDSWLGESAIGENADLLGKRAYYIEFGSYYPFNFTVEQYAVYDLKIVNLVKYLIKYYKGRLHTGKNMKDIWESIEVKERYSYDVAKFQEFVEDFDPFGVFSNDLAQNLGVVWPEKGEKFGRFYYFKKSN